MCAAKFDTLNITDTTLRDAHQSLIATRLRTEDMLPLARAIDKVGFFSVEAWGGATFDSCIRFLNDDPWDRLRELKAELKRTPIQMLLRGQNLVGYRHYPDDVVEKFVAASAQNGVGIFRVFDALNDIRNMSKAMKEVKNVGAHLQGAISYTTSPVHSVATFIDMAQELYALGCDSICIKDMAGLIMPHDARDLITGIKKVADVKVCLHSHCTSGVAPLSYQAAIDAGVDILDTAMSPFALGTSQPPTESIVASVAGTPRDTGIDLLPLRNVRNICREMREKYEPLFSAIADRVDSDVLIYQLPGGMITNLVSQLKEQDALDRLDEVFHEVPRVRKDLGYPPLVTPTSQIVGTQAVFNVLMGGERYRNVTTEVKDYVRGLYGRSPAPIGPEIRKLIIGDEEPVTGRPADLLSPIYDEMRQQAVELGLVTREEDVLTYILYPSIAPSFLRGERQAEVIPEKATAAGSVGVAEIPRSMEVEVDGEIFSVRIVTVDGGSVAGPVPAPSAKERIPRGEVAGGVKSNMQGMVLKVMTERGSTVQKGDTLIVLEAMKMENPIRSPRDGTVGEIFVDAGDVVQNGDVLMVID
ncbi:MULTISPECIES: pyruvate/oxaloacetate carboxyltransferase [unclassified Methanoculleus]|uniref:pyruvate/oxaloacetate carboxyltransferase n=1 Tax=unclassified Methanoculleus TaxID=2619537 RepID=UPI0025E127EB|nr:MULTISPECIES: pyruvate/oxaloacetate carboxyltransferase [unclassified Methanoculleus]MCK9318561.1 pyruvate/oxaloacetate carboxyltransferase [Methanoculleus sp.]MDD2253118.1 pyruvate/oxaloacetate carboxyltransferase [Methanoculleus sp.]MDD2787537.1 pyruvate/oxaloacetate carboxyltransferase [Methanoculleus sp.]MDD3216955.1 pyruvate/oxaloacetate carboxyltransferase [Methanoculleus sp.]MDD4313322.1 pyruvate/oxaloacetate carboxyltransferase [Methanoculleus sp.]